MKLFKTKDEKAKILLEKKILQQQLLKEYSTPTKVGKKFFAPTEQDVETYYEELNGLSLSALKMVSGIKETKKVQTAMMGLKKLKRKKSLLITIHNINNTKSHYITSQYTRFCSLKKRKYLIIPSMAKYDTIYKIPSLEFYENNPMPIDHRDDKPSTVPDTTFLQESMHFEFATKLAQASEMMKKVDITMVFAIMSCVLTVVVGVIVFLVARKLEVL